MRGVLPNKVLIFATKKQETLDLRLRAKQAVLKAATGFFARVEQIHQGLF